MNVGLLSPGEMGSAVAATLRDHGVAVRTCLDGRSARTRGLAERDGLEVTATLADLVLASDVVMSIVPPASALEVARAVAAAIRATGARPLYVDCNAVAPSTVRAVAAIVGGEVVDVGIIGAPPGGQGTTRFYASGPQAERLELPGLDVRAIGAEVGTASALKMCYAALTKGFTALATELLVAAQLLGVEEQLAKELTDGQSRHREIMARQIPRMPTVAHRWVGEMEEIAKTFAELGLTPRILEGAADLYRFAAASPVGAERPETRDMRRGLDETIDALARAAKEPSRAR
ncbi:MAG TPA: DUF1932 domain-containing protein [Candidatus Limnocylindria bacterium]|nr:DUF1932 domain-containing protein [Candidatus Limnocylindria bacterium]